MCSSDLPAAWIAGADPERSGSRMTKVHPARVPEYLQHIVEAIDRATGYVAGMDAAAFEQDTRTQTP